MWQIMMTLDHAPPLRRGRPTHKLFIGPADCNHRNRDRVLLGESGKLRSVLVLVSKQIVVTVAVVIVCWPYEHFSTHLDVCMYAYVCVYIYVYVCVCIYIYIYIHMCVYICIYIYIYIHKLFDPSRWAPRPMVQKTLLYVCLVLLSYC